MDLSNQIVKKDRKRWPSLFIVIVIIIFIAIHLRASVNSALLGLIEEKTVWELSEGSVCLYPDRTADLKGYEIRGNCFVPTEGDPQIGFNLQDEFITALLIDLNAPVTDSVSIEIYYDGKTGQLSEDRKVESTLKKGETQLMIEMPPETSDYIRIDINGTVELKGIYYTNSAFVASQVQLPLPNSKVILVYAACVLFFIAILCSVAMVLFGRWKQYTKSPYIITALARVWLGSVAGLWYPQAQRYDDALIFHYSDFASYFAGREVPSKDIMLKELGMPIILNFVNLTGINYAVFLSVLWVLSGLLAVMLLRKINREKRPKIEFLTFVFVIFQPIALEMWTGTRLYRNSLLTPMYFLVFLFALLILFDLVEGSAQKLKEALRYSIPLGIVFSLAYLIKEDGIWLLLSISVLAVLMLCVCIYHLIQKHITRGGAVKAAFAICIPFVILFLSVTAVKQVNLNAFGIYATNARTAGEEGKFVTYVYKTASEERTLDVWAPTDAIDKVFNASETLNKNKALREAVFNTPWKPGNIKDYPIQGDFLTWVMKDALFDSGTCTTKQEAEQYMKKVNQELEEAFKNGALKADHRFRLTSSMAGISKQELLPLLKNTILGYKNMINTGLYGPGAAIEANDGDNTQYESIMANLDLNTVSAEKALYYRKLEVAIANSIIGVIFRVYNYIQPVLLALGLIATIAAVWHLIKSMKERSLELHRFVKSLLVLFFLALSFVYLFVISWFCYYLHFEYFSFFFGIGALPLIILLGIIGVSLLDECMLKKRRKRV